MEREFLERQLAEGRSLEYIGALVGKDPSTVGYWLKKHGLVLRDTRMLDPVSETVVQEWGPQK